MAALLLHIDGGAPRAELVCGGCGNWFPARIPVAAISTIGALLLVMPGRKFTMEIEGVYYAPCCADRARNAMAQSNARLRAKERYHNGK